MTGFVTDNQNLLIGVIGFLGVILTIISNGRLSRTQHRHELEQERRSIKRALIKELELLVEAYKLRICQFSEAGSRKVIIPEYKCNNVYLGLLPKIGFLKDTEIEKVLTAHQLNEELHIRLALLTSDIEALESERYVIITADKAHTAASIHEEFLKEIKLAINELEKD